MADGLAAGRVADVHVAMRAAQPVDPAASPRRRISPVNFEVIVAHLSGRENARVAANARLLFPKELL
jgi:hypothetical protein